MTPRLPAVLQAPARRLWRWLTSMRTALLLLLLLAVAAVPGSILPQRGVSQERVSDYLRTHPGSGPWLDRFQLFDVYASPWFSAIYLLLFVSLIGCLVPRLRHHIGNIVRKPPPAPARLDRLPHSAADLDHEGVPAVAGAEIAATLRRQRWRTAVRSHDDGSVTVSAEKGYIKETGNLVFHFALLALLIGVAVGSWYGWHGNRLLVVGKDHAFCNILTQYDESGLGARVQPEDLPPFCVQLDSFTARYLDNGQPIQYTADLTYTDGAGGTPTKKRLEVNDPLRLGGANVYLLGHGYAPILRYTDRYGVVSTVSNPFLAADSMLTSSGVVKFPFVNVDPSGKAAPGDNVQVAFAGVYLPTMPAAVDGTLSAFPAERDPGLQLTAYQGDLGLNDGRPQSVYSLDQRQISSGALQKVSETKALRPGDTWKLPDGTSVQFVGTQQYITVTVRADPGDKVMLIGAGSMLLGLMVSLTGRRRRVWARVRPGTDGRSLISLGGLARNDYTGFGDEFNRLATAVATPTDDLRQPVAVGEKGP